MPNVKAGDLAIVRFSRPIYNGRIVEILGVAPHGGFHLPDGRWHKPIESPGLHWVIKPIGGPLLASVNGRMKPVWYCAGSDAYLFPLPRDDDDRQDELSAVAPAGLASSHR
jgi:hypothetical protein